MPSQGVLEEFGNVKSRIPRSVCEEMPNRGQHGVSKTFEEQPHQGSLETFEEMSTQGFPEALNKCRVKDF